MGPLLRTSSNHPGDLSNCVGTPQKLHTATLHHSYASENVRIF